MTVTPAPGTTGARILVEEFVEAVTPVVTNEAQSWNLWNHIAGDTGPIRRALTWAYGIEPDAHEQPGTTQVSMLDQERLARFLSEHEADQGQTAVYEGSCSCGWREPGWNFPKNGFATTWDAGGRVREL